MKKCTLEDYRQRIGLVLTHIQENLEAPGSIDRLAAIACFSPYHFSRVFRAITDESVMEYIRRLRLEHSAMALKHTSRKVTDIAFDAGYENVESYTRAFKAMFSVAPSKYRRGIRSRREIAQSDTAKRIEGKPKEGVITVEVRIENAKPFKAIAVRHTGPYTECGGAWNKLLDWVKGRGLLGPGAMSFGIGYDDPDVTPPEKIRYDACIKVSEKIDVDGEVVMRDIPGGRYAIAVYEGPYKNLKSVYEELYGSRLPAMGLEPGDFPPFEVYVTCDDPDYNKATGQTAPKEPITEIYILLK